VLLALDDAGAGNEQKIPRADPHIVDLKGSGQFLVLLSPPRTPRNSF
jgi:hypothetical protein